MYTFDAELRFAKELAYEAGTIMLHYFNAEDKGITMKEDESPVTLADTQINDLVITRVKAAFPEHGVLGEEASFNTDKSCLWVVDPLDGTPPFARGIPLSTFCMALVKDGQPLVAVVYDPYTDRLYTAAKGQGAYENDRKLDLSKHQPIGKLGVCLEVAGGSYWTTFKDPAIGGRVLEAFDRTSDTFTYYLPIAYSIVMVAAGRFDAVVTSGKNPWDLAAAGFVAEEAGAKVTDIFGKPITRWDKDIAGLRAAKPEVYTRIDQIVAPVLSAPDM
jgi:fructose-1,6-bisphosphatase/inositol monophosphatase family enzyme